MTKRDRIEKINEKIVKLMLDRAKLRRYSGSWDKEQAVTDSILKLEAEIKLIRAERGANEEDNSGVTTN